MICTTRSGFLSRCWLFGHDLYRSQFGELRCRKCGERVGW